MTLEITEVSSAVLEGVIGGPGWELVLHGSSGFVSPMQVRWSSRRRAVDLWLHRMVGSGLVE